MGTLLSGRVVGSDRADRHKQIREESADDFISRVRVYMREHDVAAPAAVDALLPGAPLSQEAIEDLAKAGILIEAQCARMSARTRV